LNLRNSIFVFASYFEFSISSFLLIFPEISFITVDILKEPLLSQEVYMSIRSVAREIAYNIGKVAYRTETTRSIFKFGAKVCRAIGPHLVNNYQTGEVTLRLELSRSFLPPRVPKDLLADLGLPPVIINLKDDQVESIEASAKPLKRSATAKLTMEETLGQLRLIQQAQAELRNAPLEEIGACIKKWNTILAPVMPEIGRVSDIVDRIKNILAAGFNGEPFDRAGLDEALQEWGQLGASDSGLLETVAAMSTAYILYRSEPERLALELENSVRLSKNRELALQMKKIFDANPAHLSRELEQLFKNWQTTSALPTPETLKIPRSGATGYR